MLGAALKAARGDTLDYATANLTASAAVEATSEAFGKYRGSISKAGELLGQLTDTGKGWAITQPKLTEGSLAIASALTQQADTAVAAASATYQHEAALKGTEAAANDAVNVYEGYRQALIKQATQSGLTQKQALGLADQYLAMPKDIDTAVRLFGKVDVSQAITDLTIALENLTTVISKPTVSLANINPASNALAGIYQQMLAIGNTTVTPKVNTPSTAAIPGVPPPVKQASGGTVFGPGTGTSDSVPAKLSVGEEVINAAQAQRHRGVLKAINAGRYVNGGAQQI